MPALRTRMSARDSSEVSRVSSALELLFDLTFVVAISQVARQLALAGEHGHEVAALWPYCTVFFAIWWAWIGLFTLILLGESVLPSMASIQAAVRDGVTADVVIVAACGLLLLFTLWWLYFSEPSGEGLARYRNRSFFWGYGHYAIFASLAALGAGLEVAVLAVSTPGADSHLSLRDAQFGVAIPIAVFLVFLWLLHAPFVGEVVTRPFATLIAATAILMIPLINWEMAPALLVMTLAAMALLAFTLSRLEPKHVR